MRELRWNKAERDVDAKGEGEASEEGFASKASLPFEVSGGQGLCPCILAI